MPGRERIGLLLVTVRRRIKQVTSLLLQGHDMSVQQFWTMVVIARNDGLSLRELAARRQMDEPTACRVVNSLVRRRLVRRSPDPADRRRSRLMLTPSGTELTAGLLPVAEAILAAVEGALTPGERRAVVSGLRKVIANLDQFEASKAGRGSTTAIAV
ncbi:MAG: MarR family winged helix-turn-helix transcriptional regulator [Thermoanaerobaculaceae bacterium]